MKSDACSGMNVEISNLKSSVSNGKSAIASAITDKGVSTASDATFQVIVDNINLFPRFYVWEKFSCESYIAMQSVKQYEETSPTTGSGQVSYSYDTKPINSIYYKMQEHMDIFYEPIISSDGLYDVSGYNTGTITSSNSLRLSCSRSYTFVTPDRKQYYCTYTQNDGSSGKSTFADTTGIRASGSGWEGSYSHIWVYHMEETTFYRKGSISYGRVSDINPSAYPSNGRHSDGYWYVLQ